MTNLARGKIMRFEQKTVIITGAGRGLGKTLAYRFASEGANVVALARSYEEVRKVVDEIKTNGGKALAIRADVSNEIEVKTMVQQAKEVFGSIHVLINNAAIHRSIPIVETDIEIWKKILDVNLTGSFICAKEIAPTMMEQNDGKIINISSSAASQYFPGFGAYSASKAGMIGFSNVLAEELKAYNINVVSIILGLVNTEYTRSRIDDQNPEQWMQPDEVADVILYLASKEATAITGTAIEVFGGRK